MGLVGPVGYFGSGVHMHIYADFLSKTGSALSFARYKQRMVRPVLPSPRNLATGKAAKSLRMLRLLHYEKQGGGKFQCSCGSLKPLD